MAKLMGLSPLRGSHPAVPIAYGAASSLRLWLYGSIIVITESHRCDPAEDRLRNAGQNRSPCFIPPFAGHGAPVRRLVSAIKYPVSVYTALIGRFLCQGAICTEEDRRERKINCLPRYTGLPVKSDEISNQFCL